MGRSRVPLPYVELTIAAVLMFGIVAGWSLAGASHTAAPGSVTLVGSLQSEAGCAGDWDPSCAASAMAFDAADQAWQKTLNLPAGSYNYKVATNASFAETYPPGLADVPLNLASARAVRFYYDHQTHWVADNVSHVIAVAAGSFQSELGCPGDFDPSCLRSWLKDPDGDGTYTFATAGLPPGDYSALAAINESWDESYGQGGVPGVNIPFTVTEWGELVTFEYNAAAHILTILTPLASETSTPTLPPTAVNSETPDPSTPVPEPSAPVSPTPEPTPGPEVPLPTPDIAPFWHRVRLPMLSRD